jgi:hypothetical protein
MAAPSGYTHRCGDYDVRCTPVFEGEGWTARVMLTHAPGTGTPVRPSCSFPLAPGSLRRKPPKQPWRERWPGSRSAKATLSGLDASSGKPTRRQTPAPDVPRDSAVRLATGMVVASDTRTMRVLLYAGIALLCLTAMAL